MSRKKHVKEIALAKILPYWRNPRNTQEAVEKVLDSVRRYGFQHPIIIDKKSVIIAGHVRYAVARILKMKTVPCVVADWLDEKLAGQLRIADNKAAELAYWDKSKLIGELGDIPDLSLLADMFDASDWMSLVTTEFGDDFSEEQQQRFNTENSLTTAKTIRHGKDSETIEVPCPHCGEDNQYVFYKNAVLDEDQQDVEQIEPPTE